MKSYFQQIRSRSSEFSLQVRCDVRPAVQQLNFDGAKALEFETPRAQLQFKEESDDLFCAKTATTSFAPHDSFDCASSHFLYQQEKNSLQFGGAAFNSSAAAFY
ncbi:MAG TPA: hypothetical protein V6C89_21605 [Drouetiella sp.]|jgi:hypothetical protein